MNKFSSIVASLLMLAVLAPASGIAAKAQGFTLQGRDAPVNLSAYRGKVVYLDFWASWCTPCRKSFPWMNAMQKQYGKYGLEVVAVNLDENRALADQFLRQTPADFTIAYDPTGRTAEHYSVQVMPSSYLIGRDGELMAVHKGFRRVDTTAMEKEIRQLLASR